MNTLAQAIALIFLVESNRGMDRQIGDEGKAVGPFQQHKIFVDDVNRISSKTFTYDDRNRFDQSRQMVEIYLSHYCTKERLGHEPGIRDYLRIYNGGPDGCNKLATWDYWLKAVDEFYSLSHKDALRRVMAI